MSTAVPNAESAPVKPLLAEALGVPFLSYVLAATEHDIANWLESDVPTLGTVHQHHALRQLLLILQHACTPEPVELRRHNLALYFGCLQRAVRYDSRKCHQGYSY